MKSKLTKQTNLPQKVNWPAKYCDPLTCAHFFKWSKNMLNSRPEDALVKLVKTVETVETVDTVETVETGETVETSETV